MLDYEYLLLFKSFDKQISHYIFIYYLHFPAKIVSLYVLGIIFIYVIAPNSNIKMKPCTETSAFVFM